MLGDMKSPLSLPSRLLVAVMLLAALAGCGGGGSSDSPLSPLPTGVVPMYGQTLHIQVSGAQMDQIEATSSACRTLLLQPSSSPPYVSTSTLAHFLCDVSAVGPQTLMVRRSNDQRTVQQYGFEVPLPQVTLSLSSGSGLNTVVLTLRPDRAPLTVDNFLRYVNSGPVPIAALVDVLADPVATSCPSIAGVIDTTQGCVPIPNVVIVSAVQTR
ncbi:MAG: hypothetical protein RJA44_701 [Pseudomonadota bacterium]